MGKNEHANRLELAGLELMESNDKVSNKFRQARWEECIYIFKGHGMDLKNQFISSFNENFIMMNGLRFRLSEATIAKAIRDPTGGEKWFKNKPFHDVHLNTFIKPEFFDPP